ncbi:MAG: hypothetical protein ABI042_07955 [Verrucomicrobiota bacterium]
MIVAVDSGFILELADANEKAWDTFSFLLEHPRPFSFIVTPATEDLLEFHSRQSEEKSSLLAFRALKAVNSEWKIKTASLDDSQRKLTWIVGYHLRQSKIISEEMRIESDLIAEAILIADLFLVSENSPLYKVDHRELALETRLLGLSPTIICTPGFLRDTLSE